VPTVYFTSDTHFGHLKALDFRPGFDNIEQHNEFLIAQWNSVVRPSDMVWHLGDVALGNKSYLQCLLSCNGRKKLIMGNHDKYKFKYYTPWFDEIYGAVRAYHGMILTHIPIHPANLEFRWKANIHGHIHDPTGYDLGANYINVCTDVRKFAPVSLDQIKFELSDAY